MAEEKKLSLDEIEGMGVNPETPSTEIVTKEAKNNEVKQIVNELQALADKDPEFLNIHRSLTPYLEVTRVLGFGNSEGVVDKTDEAIDKAVQAGTVTVLADDDTTPLEVTEENGVIKGVTKLDHSQSNKKKYIVPINISKTDNEGNHVKFRRVSANESKIVGYIIRNTGTNPIDYKTEVYAVDENGKWVGQEVDKVLAPGDEAQITRKYLAQRAIQPDLFCKLANGVMTGKVANGATIDEALASHYFQYSPELDMDVHSPEVKIQIGVPKLQNGKERYIVADEYAETFGWLNNAKETAGRRAGKKPGSKFDKYDVKSMQLLQRMKAENRM